VRTDSAAAEAGFELSVPRDTPKVSRPADVASNFMWILGWIDDFDKLAMTRRMMSGGIFH
jgi:hypothetical protein